MTAIRMLLVMTVLCGLIYPLAITVVAQVLFPHQAHGSLIVRDGRVLGSELIGQHFEDPRYFWGRPSATPLLPYNAVPSAGSNLGPNNPARKLAIEERRKALLAADPGNAAPVPADLLMASGSGLDPHISPEAALWQAGRVARLRGQDKRKIEDLVKQHIQPRQFGILGEPVVNVLLLNQALDRL
jgi:K+-transporting ATPase ATPase C chain